MDPQEWDAEADAFEVSQIMACSIRVSEVPGLTWLPLLPQVPSSF